MPLTLYNQFEGHRCHWTCKWCKCLAISIHSYSFWETSVTMWIPMWIEHKWTWQSWLSLAGCQRRSHVSLGGPLQYGPFSGSTCKSCKHQERSEYQPFAPLTETCKWPKLVQNLSTTIWNHQSDLSWEWDSDSLFLFRDQGRSSEVGRQCCA